MRPRTGRPAAAHHDPLKPPGDGRGQVRAAPGLQVQRHLHVASQSRAEHVIEVTVIEGPIQVVLEGSELAEVDDEARAGEHAGGKDDLYEKAAAIRCAITGTRGG